MGKKKLRFFFDYAGACLWNDGAVDYKLLPISTGLLGELNDLCNEFDTQINWECPLSSIPWTQEQENDFKYRSTLAYEKLKSELRDEYEIMEE